MSEQSTQTVGDRRGGRVPDTLTAYALAFAALVAAVLLRYLLDPWMGDALPLVTLFGAVAAGVWLGGYRPAIVVAVAGYFAASYLFIQPRGRVDIVDSATLIGLLAYCFTCFLIIGVRRGARVAQTRASDQREVLRVTLRSIGDAVITTDVDGRVTYMNAVAESLTGWTQADGVGQPLDTCSASSTRRRACRSRTRRRERFGSGVVVGLANHTLLIRRTAARVRSTTAPRRSATNAARSPDAS